jgi:hypothetical protein
VDFVKTFSGPRKTAEQASIFQPAFYSGDDVTRAGAQA